jgi:hypothetical protein
VVISENLIIIIKRSERKHEALALKHKALKHKDHEAISIEVLKH